MLCELLEWDTAFFGRRIARVNAQRLDPDSAVGVAAWCRAHAIDCLYLLADPSDAETIRLAEANDYYLVDIRLTLQTQLLACPAAGTAASAARIGAVQPDEVSALRAIAGVSHRDSRFYFDANFDRALCDRLYETWIEKCCRENPAGVLVARDGAEPVGYIACQCAAGGTGQVTLLAVAPGAQGQGLGQALVTAGLRWCWDQGARQVSVVTQGRNLPALRLYQKLGFRVERLQFWYHRWFPGLAETHPT